MKNYIVKDNSLKDNTFVVQGGGPLKQLVDRLPMEVFSILRKGMASSTGAACTSVFYGMKLEGYRFALMAAVHACTPAWKHYDYEQQT